MKSIRHCDVSQFQNPDAFYWPGYIWFWNDRITRKRLAAQLKDMADHGARSVWPLPVPKSFRPDWMPTRLEPDYLSAEFLDRYRDMVREARRRGMKVWLYDEGGWPSGMVCGRIVRKDPRLARQSLDRRVLTPKTGDVVVVPRRCLSAFLCSPNKGRHRVDPGTVLEIEVPKTTVELFFARRVDPAIVCEGKSIEAAALYPDLLNPKAVDEFIQMTHEVFRKAVGAHFGTTIPLIFSDEPKVANPPWTDGLAEDFRRRYGYDIRERLPDLFKGDEAEGMKTRVDFFDWWSRRFAETFFERIARWCRRSGVLFAGHLAGDGDSGHIGPRLHGFGQPLRILRKLDIPGIDTVWRQIFPGKKTFATFTWRNSTSKSPVNMNHFFPKHASTAAHQEGKPWVITESFCVYGSGLTPAEMKWVTDFQYVRGANLMTMGAYQLSNHDHFMGGQRPLAGPSNPLWKHMDIYHGYVARLSHLLSLGKPAVDTAIYYPVRDIWAGGPELDPIVDAYDALGESLLKCQCDFDLVDDDVLERGSTRIEKGCLKVGPMRYRTIFVSRTRWMTQAAERTLRRFAQAGGQVFYVDWDKRRRPPAGGRAITLSQVPRYANPLIHVAPARATIRVCKRRLSNGSLYFITHESLRPTRCSIRFRENLPAYVLDPETGACRKLPDGRFADGTWTLPLKLDFAGSCVVLFTRDALAATPCDFTTSVTLLTLDRGWSCRKVRTHRVGEHDLEVGDEPRTKAMPIPLGDWRKRVGKDFSGDIEYRIQINCDKETADQAVALDLGTVRYACQVYVNGRSVGRRVWAPHVLPIRNRLKCGRNEIRVIVTNTLANQYVTTKALDKWSENIVGPYHSIAKNFEADSLPSGLFGPVRIIGRRS